MVKGLPIAHAGLWRAGQLPAQSGLSTGYPALDALLPEAGWPLGGLTEILLDATGIGALRLWLPAWQRLQQAGRWLLWVDPPADPYAPALQQLQLDLSRLLLIRLSSSHAQRHKETLWALEQALRFELCGAALAWLGTASMPALRRLQLAAETSGSCGILYRPLAMARQSSPAALRLCLQPRQTGLHIEVLKCRGGWAGGACELTL
ncbi:MAG: translesion DNA synthesis-associated protein ImuA [Gammaproteobacteria bacterium]|nr:translesion DNA synthesis-associated protein ImuA [Gammaproteobacteria bacterium]